MQRRWLTYEGTTCSEEFNDFDRFARWAVDQPGYGRGFDLDKDLLGTGLKRYSRETCCFLPKQVNLLIRGGWAKTAAPGAVRYGPGNWHAVLTGKDFGTFSTEVEAHARYCEVKQLLVTLLAEKHRAFLCQRSYDALISWEVTSR